MKEIELEPRPDEYGTRLDSFVASRLPELTRSAAQKLIEKGLVSAGQTALAKSCRVSGEIIKVYLPKPVTYEVKPENIPLSVLYEDDWLLAVDKPRGMVVHPGAGNPGGTLVNALLYHCGEQLSGMGGMARPGIVHRLDKDTSGLLLVAKNDAAHENLSKQLAKRTLTRIYHTIVTGVPREWEGSIDAPVSRHPADRKRMAAGISSGRSALTHYRVLESLCGHSYMECRLVTGRTHQIRVHMAYIGHPILGDAVYGRKPGKKSFLSGQCLHAKRLAFTHPADGRLVELESPLPEYFTDALRRLRPPEGLRGD